MANPNISLIGQINENVMKNIHDCLKDRGYQFSRKVLEGEIWEPKFFVSSTEYRTNNKEVVKTIQGLMEKYQVTKALILTKSQTTKMGVISFIPSQFFTINPIKHKYQPKFTRLNKKPSILEGYEIAKILTTDPVVLWYNWPVGAVIACCNENHEVDINSGFCCKKTIHRIVSEK